MVAQNFTSIYNPCVVHYESLLERLFLKTLLSVMLRSAPPATKHLALDNRDPSVALDSPPGQAGKRSLRVAYWSVDHLRNTPNH